MPDEPITENIEPAPASKPETPAPEPQGRVFIPNTGMTPDWVKARTNTCGYQYGAEACANKIDPNVAFKDPETSIQVCDAHVGTCENCVVKSLKYRMHQTDDGSWHCAECFANYYIACPNCTEVVEKEEIFRPTRSNRYSMKNGGCIKCANKCISCDRVIDKDSTYTEDDNDYCEECHSEHFTFCEGCNDTVERDDSNYVENVGEFCNDCYHDRYTTCSECEKTIEKSDAQEIDENPYCEECYEKKGPAGYAGYTEDFTAFSYTKKDRYLNLLYKLLPITIKDLKTKQPSLAGGLADLISFSKGKPLTKEIVDEYRSTLTPEEFPVEYTVWDGGQRSIDSISRYQAKPQLVLNIVASSQMLAALQAEPVLYSLFDKSNQLSKKSGHPFKDDQIGWVRLEIDPQKQYILVDEIQSDHSNIINRLKNPKNDHEAERIHSAIKEKYNIDDETLDELLSKYWALVKDFPNIASQSVVRFAQQNGIKKLFWHTYESGKELKRNEPPKSLYDKTPKENFFLPSSERPFGLEGKFFEKEAKTANNMYKLARKLYFKNLNKII